tara:strand:- start:168 stop:494 length:327 start_codon:yes stop_codon:yes gene_type:complete
MIWVKKRWHEATFVIRQSVQNIPETKEMVIYKYTIAWSWTHATYTSLNKIVSFGPGPDGEDQTAPVLAVQVGYEYDTLEEACEYLDSSASSHNWELATPFIIKSLVHS